MQQIVPTKQNLYKWKITNSNLCNYCRKLEDYEHYFMSCPFLTEFWKRIYDILSVHKYKIEMKIKLKHLVFGYKIFDKEYFWFNYFLTIISFSIYKSYYVSEQRKNTTDTFKIFVKEFNQSIRINSDNEKLKALRAIYKHVLKVYAY